MFSPINNIINEVYDLNSNVSSYLSNSEYSEINSDIINENLVVGGRDMAASQQKKKKQHYVPQCYLEAWAMPGTLEPSL